MKLQCMCLDSALDLTPLGHFELGFFASRIGRSEMECAALNPQADNPVGLRPHDVR